MQYRIDAEYAAASAAAMQAFRTDIKAATAEWAAFKSSLQASQAAAGQATANINKVTAAAKAMTAASTAAAAAQARVSTASAQAQTSAVNTNVQAQQTAAARIVAAHQSVQTAVARTAQASQAAAKQAAAQGSGFGQLAKAIQGTDDSANRLSFTFRRLFGIMAAFTAARTIVSLFKDAVVETVAFNARLQQTELGIAAVIGAVGDVRNASGAQVSASEKLTIAQGIARKQVQLLRIDALRTTASFDDLAEAFQNALGPGLAAGLNVDQIRAFSREISIAAETIGLKQNQLAEEVRSILSGNISVRNTRIATALGITPKDIANAKAAGDLFGFLQNKFAVFNAAGEKVAKTLPGVFSNVKKAISLILGAGGEALSKDLQKSLDATFKSLVRLNAAATNIELNPALVEAVKAFDEGLQSALKTFEDLASQVSSDDIVKAARGLGQIIAGLVAIASPVVEGLIRGFAAVGAVLIFVRDTLNGLQNAIVNAFGGVGLFVLDNSKDALSNIVVYLVASIAFLLLFRTAIGAAGSVGKFITSSLMISFKLLGLSIKDGALQVTGLAKVLKSLTVAIVPVLPQILLLTTIVLSAAAAWAILNDEIDVAANKSFVKSVNNAENFAKALGRVATGQQSVNNAVKQLDKETSEFSSEISKAPDRGVFDNLEKSLDKLSTKFVAMFSDLKKAAADALESQDVDGIILSTSNGLKKLSTQLQALEDEAAASRARAQADIAAIGVPGETGQAVRINAAAAARSTKEILGLEQDRKANLDRLAVLQRNIASGEISSAKDLELAEGTRNALLEQNKKIMAAELEIRKALTASVREEITALALLESFNLKRSNAATGPEAANAEKLRIARQQHDEEGAAAIEAKQALDELIIKQRQQSEDRQQELGHTLDLLSQSVEREKELAALPTRTDAQQLELEDTRRSISAQNEKLDLLQQQAEQQTVIAEQARLEAENRVAIAKDIADSPIATGLVEAFGRAFLEVSNRFQTTINIMTSAIKGFSAFVAESIVSAFDPTNDTSVKERFARFLQSLATQIIETLVTLAITAAVLNAASGGLLGPLLQGFAKARGFHEGGPAEGRHEGGRSRRSHRRAPGYADGGAIVARGVHGVERPASGLHPADTVPIWADPSEWIIRGRSVAKAGADAIQTINEGLFDPYALRGALGLDGFRRPVSTVSKGQGFADGGSVASASASVGRRSATTGGAPVPAVVVSSENEMDRLLRGGSNAMDRYLAERGYFPASRR